MRGFPAAATGVSASPPTTQELISFTHRFVNQYSPDGGLGWSPNKVARVVVAFNRKFPRGSWVMFWGYLAWGISDTLDTKIARRAQQDLHRFISYADPTGDTAVSRVMRQLSKS